MADDVPGTELDAPSEPLSVVDGRMSEPRYLRFGEDEACIFTTISPVKKTSNEDCLLVVPISDQQRVLVVADGVGGMPAGEHASRLAIETVSRYLTEGIPRGVRIRELLLDAIEAANNEIRTRSDGSATTLAAVEIDGSLARTYHVGDSEILFHSDDDGLLWKCLPHSPVGYKVESGQIDADEALFDETRHLVSNVLGADVLSVEINGTFELRSGETLLLGSDGVFDNLRLEEIMQFLARPDLREAASGIIDECQRRMAHPDAELHQPSKPDDLTMILYRWRAMDTVDDEDATFVQAPAEEDATMRQTPEEPPSA